MTYPLFTDRAADVGPVAVPSMIDLAARNYKDACSLENLIKERFGLTRTRYWQLINRLR